MNTTTNTRGVSEVHRPLLQEARDQLHSLAGGFVRADQLIARIDAALSAEPAAQEAAEAKDAEANGYLDGLRDGIRLTEAATPAQPAEQGEALSFKERVALEVGADEASEDDILSHVAAWVKAAKSAPPAQPAGGKGVDAVSRYVPAKTCQCLTIGQRKYCLDRHVCSMPETQCSTGAAR